MNTTEVKQVEVKTRITYQLITNYRDGAKEALDASIANGADALDPYRNWMEGRYEAFAKVLDLMGMYE